MDRLDTMQAFTRIVERRSFTQAAQDLSISRSTLTEAIKAMEARLGVRLLQRTTRSVTPTQEGEAYYHRCLSILAQVEEADTLAADSPRGVLKVDVHGTLARHFLLPGLPAFLEANPELDIVLSEGDRLVDLVGEGVDCVLRVGILQDSDMVARQVALLDEVTVASPDYLARHGTPQSPAALAGHAIVGFHSSRVGHTLPLELMEEGEAHYVVLPAHVTVTGADTYRAAALQGLGIAQLPRYHVAQALSEGRLVELLPDTPPAGSPVSLLYPSNRQLSPRVRVFMDWVAAVFEEHEP